MILMKIGMQKNIILLIVDHVANLQYDLTTSIDPKVLHSPVELNKPRVNMQQIEMQASSTWVWKR